ncbi:hypothetical protein HaLaN_32432 [Haematococcus lacustris]|uniref:Uncharacterized protein n=1 Tax=Haematococcus lacustris TaxID=44745 RepID=A0A6A0AJJ5_HAELA|nr:hypothetical protein HaLaN_32432 [Haematococcus lacustris]
MAEMVLGPGLVYLGHSPQGPLTPPT